MASLQDVQQQVAQDEEVVDVAILQKDGSPYLSEDGKTPATIGVVGSESKQYRHARDEITRRVIRSARGKLSPEDVYKSRVESAAAAVVRWNGWESGKKPWPCTKENVRALLQHEHILVQVESGISEHADFFAKPSGN